ncbi:MAG: hypothetical protein R2784_10730 [Saprospiraceae bacterium]
MKFFYLFCFLLLSFSGFSQSNCSECDKIKIVGVYDFLASPQTPGGNYILLLLTLSEDLSPGFNTFYVDIFLSIAMEIPSPNRQEKIKLYLL